FGEHVHEILNQLENLKLPDQIIDFAPLYAGWMEKLEGAVAKGEKAKIAFAIARASGALDFVNRKLADYLIKQGADPNVIWRNEIVPAISGKFNETRGWVVKEINKGLGSKAFDRGFEQVAPVLGKITFQTESGFLGSDDSPQGGADTQPYPSAD